jgi:hypothetical protein
MYSSFLFYIFLYYVVVEIIYKKMNKNKFAIILNNIIKNIALKIVFLLHFLRYHYHIFSFYH